MTLDHATVRALIDRLSDAERRSLVEILLRLDDLHPDTGWSVLAAYVDGYLAGLGARGVA